MSTTNLLSNKSGLKFNQKTQFVMSALLFQKLINKMWFSSKLAYAVVPAYIAFKLTCVRENKTFKHTFMHTTVVTCVYLRFGVVLPTSL